jgi:putative ABC transport system permease protein
LSREEFAFLRSRARLSSEMGMATGRGAAVRAGKENIQSVDLEGESPNFGVINSYEAVDGRFLSDTENDHRLNAAFIGKDVKDQLFPNSSPVGRPVVVEGIPFTVVGVSKAKGSVFGQSQDKFVIIPIETYFKIWGRHDGITYAAQAIDHEHLMGAQEETRMLLRVYRHLGPKAEDTFAIVTSGSLLDFWNQLTGAIAATAVAVVSVFLVVGGVVILIAGGAGRADWRDVGLAGGGFGSHGDTGTHFRAGGGGGDGSGAFHGGGPVFRNLSGATSRQARPH